MFYNYIQLYRSTFILGNMFGNIFRRGICVTSVVGWMSVQIPRLYRPTSVYQKTYLYYRQARYLPPFLLNIFQHDLLKSLIFHHFTRPLKDIGLCFYYHIKHIQHVIFKKSVVPFIFNLYFFLHFIYFLFIRFLIRWLQNFEYIY